VVNAKPTDSAVILIKIHTHAQLTDAMIELLMLSLGNVLRVEQVWFNPSRTQVHVQYAYDRSKGTFGGDPCAAVSLALEALSHETSRGMPLYDTDAGCYVDLVRHSAFF
jgi:hypothetical protein